ncbi:dual specificity tyrosine-phosphorylation-regulated kinase 2-like [Petromyzon marinus]|uniref:dual specificity tyrosine-phosphorylation-regulated kinase 2-like n=1 Tax=Petromyzon marinus TaxID=7757 RepID=UPI003F7131B5
MDQLDVQSAIVQQATPSDEVVFPVAGMSCTPQEILDKFQHRMTAQECQEIMKFNEVFYFKIRSEHNGTRNDGYDDVNDHYIPITDEHVVYRFQVLNVVGTGSFGQVLRCLDHKTKREVAIKVLELTSSETIEECEMEVQILNALQSEDEENNYIIRLFEFLMFRNHPAIVMELLA